MSDDDANTSKEGGDAASEVSDAFRQKDCALSESSSRDHDINAKHFTTTETCAVKNPKG